MLPIWSFLAVAVPLVLTPGASTAVVLRNSVAGGSRAGIETAAGVNAGSLIYGIVSAFGLAMALQQWPSAWSVLRSAGTIYLAWLGVRAIRAALGLRGTQVAAAPSHGTQSAARNVYEGVLTNLLNPAIATFYLVLVPRFVPRPAPFARSVLVLTTVHVLIAFTWHVVWAISGGALARALSNPRARRTLDACTGAALLALAARLSLSR